MNPITLVGSQRLETPTLSSAFFQSQQQADTEQTVCSMITSLEQNTYNEYGDPIVLSDFNPSNWKSSAEYINLAKKASPVQVFFLVFSVSTCIGLLGYICYLQKKMFFKMPWIAPTRVTRMYSGLGDGLYKSDPKWEAGRISRANSGIVSMRTAVSVEGEASQTGGQTEAELSAHKAQYQQRSGGGGRGVPPTSVFASSDTDSVDGGASQTGGNDNHDVPIESKSGSFTLL